MTTLITYNGRKYRISQCGNVQIYIEAVIKVCDMTGRKTGVPSYWRQVKSQKVIARVKGAAK